MKELKLSMKKNCNGCRALREDRFSATCSLGAKPLPSKEIPGKVYEFKPDRECLKPKTNMQLIKIKNIS